MRVRRESRFPVSPLSWQLRAHASGSARETPGVQSSQGRSSSAMPVVNAISHAPCRAPSARRGSAAGRGEAPEARTRYGQRGREFIDRLDEHHRYHEKGDDGERRDAASRYCWTVAIIHCGTSLSATGTGVGQSALPRPYDVAARAVGTDCAADGATRCAPTSWGVRAT